VFVRFAICAAVWAAATLDLAAAPLRMDPTKGVSRASLALILRSMGTSVEDVTEHRGVPWLVAKTPDGRVFHAILYGCGERPSRTAACDEVQLRMKWVNSRDRTLADINAYHLKKVFGRAYMSDDSMFIGMDYPLYLKGGVTIDFVTANVLYFLRVTDDFHDAMEF
jgi:hypothetical protein